MKYLDMIVAVLWAGLAISYGFGYSEPSQFVYTAMAGLISFDALARYFNKQ